MLIHSPSQLALVLREHRERQKMSQVRAGQLVGLKQTTLSTFENHPDGTKLDTLFRILSAINVELHIVPKGDNNTQADRNGWKEEW